jgi:hypothetical protein
VSAWRETIAQAPRGVERAGFAVLHLGEAAGDADVGVPDADDPDPMSIAGALRHRRPVRAAPAWS